MKTSSPAIVSDTTGARFGTSTGRRCSADSPPGSVAVTVTVACPCAVADTITLSPETPAVATAASEVSTV